MILYIILEKGVVRIVLKKDEKIIAESGWEGDLSLSEKLLPEIDALLKKNGFSKNDAQKAVAVCDEKSSVTSIRIIETVVKAWNSVSGQ
ncbi:MAG: hypothetical protein ACD_11C00145G0022 [uncultured bacterium]|nr:MAG: hypothetical protein ACD_11C00145G0022 [uncultured bacterium]HBR71887.1 hypothetical protein [Candidatus Moranbacteria bacterium]